MPELPPILRPDGRLYRPVKLIAHPYDTDGEMEQGCVVFGTHDPELARPLALEVCRAWYATQFVEFQETVWLSDTFYRGVRSWAHDPVRGRAGCLFFALDDDPAGGPRG